MKKIILTLLAVAFVGVANAQVADVVAQAENAVKAPVAQAAETKNAAEDKIVTVEDILKAKANGAVSLEGTIVNSNSDGTYIFSDDTGAMIVKISDNDVEDAKTMIGFKVKISGDVVKDNPPILMVVKSAAFK